MPISYHQNSTKGRGRTPTTTLSTIKRSFKKIEQRHFWSLTRGTLYALLIAFSLSVALAVLFRHFENRDISYAQLKEPHVYNGTHRNSSWYESGDSRTLPFSDEVVADFLLSTNEGSFWLPRPPKHPIGGYEKRGTDSGFMEPDSLTILMFRNHNAGDLLALFLAPLISARIAIPDFVGNLQGLAVVGSTLNKAPRYSWGAGFIEPKMRYIKPQTDHRIFAFRGPKSREQYVEAHPQEKETAANVFGDAGLLMSWVYQPHDVTVQHELCLIPHYVDHDPQYLTPIHAIFPHVRVISILGPLFEIMDEIVRCRFVLSSSLHGIIFADSYQIPNAHIMLSQAVAGGTHKFLDYHSAVQRELRTFRWEDRKDDGELRDFVKAAHYSPPRIDLGLYWQACPMHAVAYKRTRKQQMAFAIQHTETFVQAQKLHYLSYREFEDHLLGGKAKK